MVIVKNETIINMPTYLRNGSKAHPTQAWMTNIYNSEELKY